MQCILYRINNWPCYVEPFSIYYYAVLIIYSSTNVKWVALVSRKKLSLGKQLRQQILTVILLWHQKQLYLFEAPQLSLLPKLVIGLKAHCHYHVKEASKSFASARWWWKYTICCIYPVQISKLSPTIYWACHRGMFSSKYVSQYRNSLISFVLLCNSSLCLFDVLCVH